MTCQVQFAVRPVPFLLSILLVPLSVCTADVPHAISFEECVKLSPEILLERIEMAYEHRLLHAKNITFRATCRLMNHEYSESGGLGDIVWEGFRFDHELWRLEESYKVTTDLYEPATAVSPCQFSQTGYDAVNGVTRSRVQAPGSPKIKARVDVLHDRTIGECRYLFWLEGPDEVNHVEYFVRKIAENCRSGKVELNTESRRAKLTISWSVDEVRHECVFEMDPEKAFFPEQGQLDLIVSPSFSRMTKFKVLEDKLVGNCWMPTVIEEVVVGDALGRELANAFVTRVETISQGTVSESDLLVEFPEGSRVVDAVESLAYSIGDDGTRIKVDELAINSSMPVVDQESSSRLSYFVIANAAVALLVIAIWAKSRKNKDAGRKVASKPAT